MPAGGLQNKIVYSISLDAEEFGEGLKNAHATVSRWAEKIAAAAAAVGAAIVASMGIALKESAAFSDKITQSLAIMGGEAQKMEGTFRDAAIGVSTSTRFSADQAAEAYYFLASAGLDAKQQIEALPIVSQFATAGMFDLATATDLLTDAQSAMGLTVKDANKNLANMNKVSDVLVKANTLANASVQQFSESLTNGAAAAAKQAGIDLEGVTAVLAALADQGIKANRAGTLFATALRDLTSKAILNKSAFEDLGLAVFDAEGGFRGFPAILGDMEATLGRLSVEQQRATLLQLGFTTESVKAISALIGLSDKVQGYENALREAGGTAGRVADNQMSSFTAQVEIAKSSMEAFAIEVGEAYEAYVPLVKLFSMGLTGARKFLDVLGPVGDWVKRMVGLVGLLMPLWYGVWKATTFIRVVQTVKAFVPLIVQLAKLIRSGLKTSIAAVEKALVALGAAVEAGKAKFVAFLAKVSEMISRVQVRFIGLVESIQTRLQHFFLSIYNQLNALAVKLAATGNTAWLPLINGAQKFMLSAMNANTAAGASAEKAAVKMGSSMQAASTKMQAASTKAAKAVSATFTASTKSVETNTAKVKTALLAWPGAKAAATKLGNQLASPYLTAAAAATKAKGAAVGFHRAMTGGLGASLKAASKMTLSFNSLGKAASTAMTRISKFSLAKKAVFGIAGSLVAWELAMKGINKGMEIWNNRNKEVEISSKALYQAVEQGHGSMETLLEDIESIAQRQDALLEGTGEVIEGYGVWATAARKLVEDHDLVLGLGFDFEEMISQISGSVEAGSDVFEKFWDGFLWMLQEGEVSLEDLNLIWNNLMGDLDEGSRQWMNTQWELYKQGNITLDQLKDRIRLADELADASDENRRKLEQETQSLVAHIHTLTEDVGLRLRAKAILLAQEEGIISVTVANGRLRDLTQEVINKEKDRLELTEEGTDATEEETQAIKGKIDALNDLYNIVNDSITSDIDLRIAEYDLMQQIEATAATHADSTKTQEEKDRATQSLTDAQDRYARVLEDVEATSQVAAGSTNKMRQELQRAHTQTGLNDEAFRLLSLQLDNLDDRRIEIDVVAPNLSNIRSQLAALEGRANAQAQVLQRHLASQYIPPPNQVPTQTHLTFNMRDGSPEAITRQLRWLQESQGAGQRTGG